MGSGRCRAHSLAQCEGWGQEGVFYVLDVTGGENAPGRACSLVRREGWQQRSAEHPEHAHMGVFGVFGSRKGLRETTSMQNTPLWACFACLGYGEGEEDDATQKTRPSGRVFRVPHRCHGSVVGIGPSFDAVGWWGLCGCWRRLVVS